MIAMFLSLLLGCGSQKAVVKIEAPPVSNAPQKPQEYLVQPGDELHIKFFYNPELNESVLVRPDGKISLQLLDDVKAAGLTPSKLDRFLTERYAQELKEPVLTVIVGSFTGQRVYVGGEVIRPRMVPIEGMLRTLDAVIQAGGPADTAELKCAVLIRYSGRPEAKVYYFNMKQIIAGQAPDIILQPYDVIYLPRTGIAEVSLFVK